MLQINHNVMINVEGREIVNRLPAGTQLGASCTAAVGSRTKGARKWAVKLQLQIKILIFWARQIVNYGRN